MLAWEIIFDILMMQVPWETIITKYGLWAVVAIGLALFVRREFEKNQTFLRERLAKADEQVEQQRQASVALMNSSMKQMDEISKLNRNAHAEEMKQMFDRLRVSDEINLKILDELEGRRKR